LSSKGSRFYSKSNGGKNGRQRFRGGVVRKNWWKGPPGLKKGKTRRASVGGGRESKTVLGRNRLGKVQIEENWPERGNEIPA